MKAAGFCTYNMGPDTTCQLLQVSTARWVLIVLWLTVKLASLVNYCHWVSDLKNLSTSMDFIKVFAKAKKKYVTRIGKLVAFVSRKR
jgi:hypothetical protein